MSKNLGLDVGTNSIGWSIVEIDADTDDKRQGRIVDMGVRIPNFSPEERDLIEKGKGETKNAARRMARQMRRQRERYQLRRKRLVQNLREMGFWPANTLAADVFESATVFQVFELRDRALREKISPQEMGLIFYQLNQRRGYKSSARSESGEEMDKSAGEYIKEMNALEAILDERNLTPGQFFYQELTSNPHYRVKNKIIRRRRNEKEFDRIWDFQQQFYPGLLNEANREELRNKTIFYQRRLKSQKGSISMCRYEKGDIITLKHTDKKGKNRIVRFRHGSKVVPKSHPLAQRFAIWTQINNLRLTELDGKVIVPTPDQKCKLFEKLNSSIEMKASAILKLCKWSDSGTVNFKNGIKGNETFARIKKAISDCPEATANALSSVLKEGSPAYNQLWHIMYSVPGQEENAKYRAVLLKYLTKKLAEGGFTDIQLTEADVSKLAAVQFLPSYGALSEKALRKLLPYMDGSIEYANKDTGEVYYLPYHEAATLVYGGHSDDLSKNVSSNAPLEKAEQHELRNPVVTQLVNETLSIVEELRSRYLRENENFDHIVIEMARELEFSKDQKKKIDDQNRKNQKRNQDLKNELISIGKLPTRKNLQRMQLWKEQKGRCFYSGATLSQRQIFDTGEVDVDHIFPRSRYFDDSMQNRVLVLRAENGRKGSLTAREYIEQHKTEQQREEIFALWRSCLSSKDSVDKSFWLPFGRYKNLLSADIPKEFLKRDLVETRYITRQLRERLRPATKDVIVSSGKLTSHLRKEWGLQDVFARVALNEKINEVVDDEGNFRKPNYGRNPHEINARVYSEDEIAVWQSENGDIVEKTRSDHRHHAVDALVLALTRRKDIQRLNTLNARGDKEGAEPQQRQYRGKDAWRFEQPWSGFVRETIDHLQNIIVSYKNGNTVLTRKINKIRKGKEIIHEQVTYAVRGPLHKETIYGEIEKNGEKIIVLRTPITGIDMKNVHNIVDEKVREVVLARLQEYGGDAKKAFVAPLYLNEAKGVEIKRVRVRQRDLDLHPIRAIGNKGKQHWVSLRNNHHTAFYSDGNGKVTSSTVPFIEVVRRMKAGEPAISTEYKGMPLALSLQRNELVIIGLEDADSLDLNSKEGRKRVARHLYRVQKLSPGDYSFRHHLLASIGQTKVDLETKKTYRLSDKPVINLVRKIKVSRTGQLSWVD